MARRWCCCQGLPAHGRSTSREFYSDYVTPLDDDIHQDGTTIHVIYALRMDPKGKYLMRYQQHFRDPDLMRFDMQHEEWLFGSTWTHRACRHR